jgi:predicted enzyme related to lactoylglutathione lyase
MPKVLHFEINADKPERTIKFYGDVFGWKFNKWQGPTDYWMVITGDPKEPGINGSVVRRVKNQTIMTSIQVTNIDETLKNIIKAGGKIVQPKETVPGVGHSARAKDSEGNIFVMFQIDPKAK